MHAGLSSVVSGPGIPFFKPCISIYLPTQKKVDKFFKTRDRVKLVTVLNKIEKALLNYNIGRSSISKILKPAKELIEDKEFWITQNESLVIFISENSFEYYQLPVKTESATYIDIEFNKGPLESLMANVVQLQKSNPPTDINNINFKQKSA